MTFADLGANMRHKVNCAEVHMSINTDMVVPAQFPELSLLVWNRNPDAPIEGRDAFSIYERNWRMVRTDRLNENEATLIRLLSERYGRGIVLK